MNNENQIFEFIEKFDFSELDKDQQSLVLANMTEEEYCKMRNTISLTSDFFENESVLMVEDLVVPEIKKESVVIKIINYKLPIYKVAAMVVVILSLNYLRSDKEEINLQVVETTNEIEFDSGVISAYAMYSSNNAIKYNTGFGRVNY